MTFDLSNTVVYDIETFPNVFTLSAEMLNSDIKSTWEISEFRDDRRALIEWFTYLSRTQTPMIGFFSLEFDYPVIHYIMQHPNATVAEIYARSMEIIAAQGENRFANQIWQDNRFAPQIDLFKINHFDNRAKTTSLKALEINMRSQMVVNMPVEVGTYLTKQQIDQLLIPYNIRDTSETKKFAHFCMSAINFRIGLMEQIKGDVLNFNDTKIGSKLLEQRIGEDICYDTSSGRKRPRQTIRTRIALGDIIFPYIKFEHPEFDRVLKWMKGHALTPDDLDDPEATVKTKGVFKNISANVGGLDYYFGTGGLHASVPPQRIIATDEWLIRDIDVEGYYPSAAVANRVAPAHLGDPYVVEYSKLKPERKEWQKKKGKKCVEANSLKLAGNGVYGHSNNPYSIFYDPQYTMTITINCQLMLCMLAEWLTSVPTLEIIQANTDGITYRIHRNYEPQAALICDQWEAYTTLTLEDANYRRMWIRDVNNYIAEDMNGKLKQKGAYWHPDPQNYAESISESQPPAWHKDLGNLVSIQAAVAYMVHGIPIDQFIRIHSDPFDFMLRVKVGGESKLLLDGRQIQKTSRYYVARNGGTLIKHSPATGVEGAFKRKNGVTEIEYQRVMKETKGEWDVRVCTKNKSKYEPREMNIQAGWKCAECNDASHFRFDNIDYAFYEAEAKKLII